MPKPEENLYEDDEDMLVAGFEELDDELKQIDSEIVDEVIDDNDQPLHKIPTTDEGYLEILKLRFGHTSFKEGQLDAIKIIL